MNLSDATGSETLTNQAIDVFYQWIAELINFVNKSSTL